MSCRFEKSWDFMRRFWRIEFSQKILKIQQKELHHVKLDKIYNWQHLFWSHLPFLVWKYHHGNKKCSEIFNSITSLFFLPFFFLHIELTLVEMIVSGSKKIIQNWLLQGNPPLSIPTNFMIFNGSSASGLGLNLGLLCWGILYPY